MGALKTIDRDAMVQAYLDGGSLAVVAAKYGVTAHTCRSELLRRGIQCRSSGGINADVLEPQVVSLYQEGKSATEIAGLVGLSDSTCLRILERRGIERRPNVESLSDVVQEEAVQLYRAGATIREAADALSVSATGVRNALVRHGEDLRRTGPARALTLNERFFQSIDTEQKAYWLGFIAADGNVIDRMVRIGLCTRDRRHLQKFLHDTESNSEIIDTTRMCSFTDTLSHMSTVRLCCAQMVQDLAQWGVVPRKSLIYTPPDLPPRMARHFWRGMVDGDGSVMIHTGKNGITAANVGLVGSRQTAEGFAKFVSDYVVTRSVAVPQRGFKIWRAFFGGIALPQHVVTLLYDYATVFLDRKMEAAKRIQALPVERSKTWFKQSLPL